MSDLVTEFKKLNLNGKLEKIKNLELEELESNLEEILDILPQEHWLVRSKLIDKLSHLPETKIIPLLISYLKPGSELSNIRNAAMEVLVKFGKKAVPYLVELLNNPNPDIRLYGVVTLGEIADPSSVDHLKKLAYDTDENVAQAAIEALGKVNSPDVVPFLISLLNEDFWLQYPAVMVLGKLKDPTAIEPLKRLLSDEMLKFAVIEALGNIGGSEAIQVLVETLEKEKDVVSIQELLKALIKIIENDGLSEVELENFLPEEKIVSLGARKELHEAVDALLNSSDPDEKNAGIKLCGFFRLTSCIEKLLLFLENDFFQESSYQALKKYPHSIIEDIKGIMGHPNKFVRRYVVKLMTEKGSPIEDVVVFMTDPESIVRSELANQLLLYGKEAVPYLFEMLHDPDESVRNTAFVQLLSFETEDIKSYLIKIVRDRMFYQDTLPYFINLSSEFHIHELLEDFKEIFNSSESRSLKIDLLKAIIEIDREKGLKYLSDLTRNLTKDELIKLFSSLSGKVSDEYLPLLSSLLESDDEEIKFNTYLVIASIKSKKALSILIDALSEENLQLKVFIASLISDFNEKIAEVHRERLFSIINSLLKTDNYDLQREIIKILEKFYSEKSTLEIVKKFLRSPHWSVRLQSLIFLKKLDEEDLISHDIIEALSELVRKESDPLVFEMLMEILKEKNIRGSLDVVISIFPELPDPLKETASKYLADLRADNPDYVMKIARSLPFAYRKIIEEKFGEETNMDGAEKWMD